MKYVKCRVGYSWVADGLPSMQKAPGAHKLCNNILMENLPDLL